MDIVPGLVGGETRLWLFPLSMADCVLGWRAFLHCSNEEVWHSSIVTECIMPWRSFSIERTRVPCPGRGRSCKGRWFPLSCPWVSVENKHHLMIHTTYIPATLYIASKSLAYATNLDSGRLIMANIRQRLINSQILLPVCDLEATYKFSTYIMSRRTHWLTERFRVSFSVKRSVNFF